MTTQHERRHVSKIMYFSKIGATTCNNENKNREENVMKLFK